MKSYLKVFILSLTLLFVVTAQAEPGYQDPVGTSNYATDMQKALPSIIAGMDNFEKNFYEKAQPIGVKLFTILAVIALSLGGAKIAMASGESLSQPMTELFRSIFLLGVVFYTLGTDGYQLLVKGSIGGLTNALAEIALPPGADMKTGFIDFTSAQMAILSKVWTENLNTNWWDIISLGSAMILTVVLLVLFIIFSLIAFIAFLSATLIQSIAFAVGPIFLAFLTLEKTSFLFDGWIKFTIAACFTKVIVAMLTTVGLFTFEAIVSAGSSAMSTMIISVAVGGMIAFQMFKAPEIAQSLVSGGAVSFGRFISSGGRSLVGNFKK